MIQLLDQLFPTPSSILGLVPTLFNEINHLQFSKISQDKLRLLRAQFQFELGHCENCETTVKALLDGADLPARIVLVSFRDVVAVGLESLLGTLHIHLRQLFQVVGQELIDVLVVGREVWEELEVLDTRFALALKHVLT